MTTFVYVAKKNTAETVKGNISANSQEEAVDLISQLGLLPVSVEVHSLEQQKSGLARPRPVKTKDLYLFSRQLANLLRSGVSLVRALAIIEEQTQNAYFRNVLAHITSEIKNGLSFSESLLKFPVIFSSLYVTMVRAGEEGGRLEEMLVSVSDYQQQQQQISSKVRSALAYPLFMAVVGTTTVYFILTFVLPKMMGLFENIDGALPLPTVILLSISHALHRHGLWVLLAGALIFWGWRQWSRSVQGRLLISRLILRLPIAGEVVLKNDLARFCRTLALLLRSEVTILHALETTTPILSNESIKNHLMKCREDLAAGGIFGVSLKRSPDLPPMMGHLIAIGEESGNLYAVLEEIASSYEQEMDQMIKLMTSLLEPIMILVIGLVIGFIVFALLLPVFQIDVLAH